MKLRVATYNVHKCKGLDGRVSVKRIADVLSELNADVIAMQEIFLKQAQELADRIGIHCAFGENRQLMGDAYGNVVLSRHSLRSHCNYDVSVAGREKRGCLRTDVLLQNRAVHVFNVHLGTDFFERRQQAKRLVEETVLRAAISMDHVSCSAILTNGREDMSPRRCRRSSRAQTYASISSAGGRIRESSR